jgi:hypothetical protein
MHGVTTEDDIPFAVTLDLVTLYAASYYLFHHAGQALLLENRWTIAITARYWP